jgi:HPt (histidine-containing phosphotransfer) domain-containing protein
MGPDETAIDSRVLDALRALNEEGQPDVVNEVLALFLASAPAQFAAIEAAVETRDAAALQRSAHTLKGASSTIGATALQAVCRRLEEFGKQQQLADADDAMADLRREYDRVREAIGQLL